MSCIGDALPCAASHPTVTPVRVAGLRGQKKVPKGRQTRTSDGNGRRGHWIAPGHHGSHGLSRIGDAPPCAASDPTVTPARVMGLRGQKKSAKKAPNPNQRQGWPEGMPKGPWAPLGPWAEPLRQCIPLHRTKTHHNAHARRSGHAAAMAISAINRPIFENKGFPCNQRWILSP